MPLWNIREAQESDMDRLIEMRLVLQKHHEERNPQMWRMSTGRREGLRDETNQLLSDENSCVFVALDGSGNTVGMVVGRIIESEHHEPAIFGTIERLFVSEAWRRCGVGIGLVRQVGQFFAERDIEEVTVKYIAGNTEGIQLWDKLGFQPRLIIAGTKLHDLQSRLKEGRD